MQETASRNIGESNNNLEINWYGLSLFIANVNKIAPKKVLPESPINIFAGFQLKKIKTKSEKTNDKRILSSKEIVVKANNIEEASRPSRQSRKLQKFIIPVPTIHKEKNKTNVKRSTLNLNNEEKEIITITDSNWKKYLFFEDIENLSSKKPTIDKGKQITIKYEPFKIELIEEYTENTIPAPLGTGLEWELLEFGRSRKYLPKYSL